MLEVGESTIKVAYTDEQFQRQLPSILDGEQPRDFHWVLMTFPTASSESLTSDVGLSVDFKDVDSQVTFTQVYQDVCNPALENFEPCWLFENYRAGEEGLAGRLQLKLGQSRVTGSVDIVWQGLTDRFGDPVQWHRHGTLSHIDIALGGLEAR